MSIEFATPEPSFTVVDEPEYTRQRLIELQYTYGVDTVRLFEYARRYGVVPAPISERDLALWEHFYKIYLETGGDPFDLPDV